MFVDAGAGDYHLQPESPCIDQANGEHAPEFDLDGNARYDHPAVTDAWDCGDAGIEDCVPHADIGAYEYVP